MNAKLIIHHELNIFEEKRRRRRRRRMLLCEKMEGPAFSSSYEIF
jgi:hypothetical protein